MNFDINFPLPFQKAKKMDHHNEESIVKGRSMLNIAKVEYLLTPIALTGAMIYSYVTHTPLEDLTHYLQTIAVSSSAITGAFMLRHSRGAT